MEEQVGYLWHRLITRLSQTDYPHAAVTLVTVQQPLGVFFRALGGDSGLRLESTAASPHHARRTWLQRLAGTHQKAELAWRDAQVLYLPARIAQFPQASFNQDLYYWLVALAAKPLATESDRGWLAQQQQRTCDLLWHYPGLNKRYQRLVEAYLPQRPVLSTLPPAERAQEAIIQALLKNPFLSPVPAWPAAGRPPLPVLLWLHPNPPKTLQDAPHLPDMPEAAPIPAIPKPVPTLEQRRQAQRVDSPKRNRGLIAARMESIFGAAESVKVDRGTEDNEDLAQTQAIADDLEEISIARDHHATASRIKFDLDLPAPAYDDIRLDEGQLYPEWDYQRQQLQPDYCRVWTFLPAQAKPCALPHALRKTARQLRAQFQILRPQRHWVPRQNHGLEIDLDAYLHWCTERHSRLGAPATGLYRDWQPQSRQLACLLLADLSLSTDSWINNQQRVIEVIQESLLLFTESLSATGDNFALYGFSSRHRQHVRLQQLKTFAETDWAMIRGRILALKPGYYTRMGAAIRFATAQLQQQPAHQRLLLLLTDGKPNDLDRYESRYGVEDTRYALKQAHQAGIQPFCITIDPTAPAYLPHLFGRDFIVLRHPAELPKRLLLLYARLTA